MTTRAASPFGKAGQNRRDGLLPAQAMVGECKGQQPRDEEQQAMSNACLLIWFIGSSTSESNDRFFLKKKLGDCACASELI